ncbi:MAG: DUF2177 family protein [Bacteroidales bacterium]
MNIKNLLLSYLLTFVAFLAIDMLWLGVIAKGLYQKYLGAFLTDKVIWAAALIFYALFIIGIFIFSIYPAMQKSSFTHALLMGALFGFFTYATYDLTNLATMKDWPLPIVFIDILWGTLLTALVSTIGFFIAKWINGL